MEKAYSVFWGEHCSCDIERINIDQSGEIIITVKFHGPKKARLIRFSNYDAFFSSDEGIQMRTSSDTPGTFGLVIELHRSTLSDWLNDESYGVARVGTGKLRHWQVSTDNECVSIFSRSEPIIGELRE